MGNFLSLIIVVAVFALISRASKQKKAQEKKTPQKKPVTRTTTTTTTTRTGDGKKTTTREITRTVPQKEQRAPAPMKEQRTPEPQKKAPETATKASDPHACKPVHRGKDGTLHPTERQMTPRVAAAHHEGDDPCHDYMLDDPNLPGCEDVYEVDAHDYDAAWADDDVDFSHGITAEDMVRGVIMSEILTRPQDRRIWKR